MNRTLGIPEWHRMAQEGTAPPMRIMLNGGSMVPLIRWNRDYITIVPLEKVPGAGDLVLFYDEKADRYVVHRAWKVTDGKVLTWGDNCPAPDGWYPTDAIWGKVVLIERGRRTIYPDPQKGLRWARFWHKVRPAYMFYRRIKDAIGRRIKKLKV